MQARPRYDQQPKPAAVTALVVEDSAGVRRLVADHLRAWGYRVIEAADGDDAIGVIQAGLPVNIVFTDVRMPGVDGFGLATWIRFHHPGIRVVLGSGASDTPEKAARLGNDDDILPKPYDFRELERRLREALAS